MDFDTYKTEILERILADPRYADHHSAIEAILRNRTGHLFMKRGLEVLEGAAKTGASLNYKEFYESCVGGDVRWNHTKMGEVAKFLGRIQQYCAETDRPILSALVVNKQTGECGAGFFKELVSLGLALSSEDPIAAAQRERERCWDWGRALQAS